MDTNEFKEKVKQILGDDYEVLGKYVSGKTPIKMLHKKCGKIYYPQPDNALAGMRCRYCYGKNKRTTESFKEEVFEKVGDEYSVVGEYVECFTKIKMKHNVCGQIFEMTPHEFLKGQRCSKCAKNHKKTHEEFAKIFDNLANGEYELLGTYVRSKDKVKVKHKKCGREYFVTPSKFMSGRRCPYCTRSLHEEFISDYLTRKNIDFEEQKSFKECVYKKNGKTRFDFYIEKFNIIIEYDGEFHYKPVAGRVKAFEAQQARDKVKNKFCKDNKIKLLRIPFWYEKKLESILDKLFNMITENTTYDEFNKWKGSLKLRTYKTYLKQKEKTKSKKKSK